MPSTTPSNPLNAESTITIAAVLTHIPVIEIREITLMMLCDFLEIRYLLAM
jgi:hypothetical protein